MFLKKTIVYLSTYLPYQYYDVLTVKTNIVYSPPSQKFHSSIISGLEKNLHKLILCSVNQFRSRIPNSPNNFFFSNPNHNLFSKMVFSIYLLLILFFIKLTNKNIVFICDILNTPLYKVSYLFSRIFKIKFVLIATDINEILLDQKIAPNQYKKSITSDGYILVADKMNDLLNLRNKPSIVIDGLFDPNSSAITTSYHNKKKIILYAGNLDKIYGVPLLLDAFNYGPLNGFELHLYGVGDFSGHITEICKSSKTVHYFGYKEHNYIVEKEKEAFLLVIPRPNDSNYNNYSFPSKTYEYMASGTVLLTSKLPNYPKNFENFVYYYNNNDKFDLYKQMEKIIFSDLDVLENKAKLALNYILKEKDNIMQTKKISNFLENL